MKQYYVTFRSVTFAQRGERILAAAGIQSVLTRTPKWMEEQGCGYALRFVHKDISEVLELLERSRVPLKRVYIRRNGHLEERKP